MVTDHDWLKMFMEMLLSHKPGASLILATKQAIILFMNDTDVQIKAPYSRL